MFTLCSDDKKSLSQEEIGKKAYYLRILYQKEFPIPKFFTISSELFIKTIKENGLYESVKEIINSLHSTDNPNFIEISNNINSLLDKISLSPLYSEQVLKYSKKIGGSLFSVRSSAPFEDGKTHSWAGGLDTFLDVPLEDVPNRIKDCWKSLFSPRALAYRIKNKEREFPSIAIIVQKMVHGNYSGVSFSIDPITNKPNILIEAVKGLGDKLVSGKVIPFLYVIKKNSFEIIKNSGGTLSKKNIEKIWKITKRIERILGFPADIEWTLKDEVAYILQARPITGKGKLSPISQEKS